MIATVKLSADEVRQAIIEYVERNGYKRADQNCKLSQSVIVTDNPLCASVEVTSKPKITRSEQHE